MGINTAVTFLTKRKTEMTTWRDFSEADSLMAGLDIVLGRNYHSDDEIIAVKISITYKAYSTKLIYS